MKLGLVFIALVPLTSLGLLACSAASGPLAHATDAGQEVSDAALPKELVCASNFCGNIVDKLSGATADCGDCTGYSQCGDNGIGNVCGSSCMPYMKDTTQGVHFCDDAGPGCTPYFTNACDLAFGFDWGSDYGTEMQFPASCSYMDPSVCVPITNPPPSDGSGCIGSVCGSFYCCVSNPGMGYNPLLPGAVAGSDGGLP